MLRMSKLSPVQQFARYSFIVVFTLGLFLGWGLSRYVGEVLIQSTVQFTALAIQPTMSHELRQEDLRGRMSEARRQEFDRFVAEHIRSESIPRIKIWNRKGMIVYSDDPSLMGHRFPVEGGLRRALDGEIAFDRSNLEKEENVAEKRFSRLLEVYVPLQVMDTKEIIGAYEVYTSWQAISKQVWKVRFLVWGSLASGLTVLYLILFGVFRNASRVIRRQRSRMKAIYEANKTLAGELRLEALLEKLMRSAQTLVKARYIALGEFGEDGRLVRFLTLGLTPEEGACLSELLQDRGLLRTIQQEGKSLHLDNIARDLCSYGCFPSVKTCLGVPIVSQGRVVGSLHLMGKEGDRPFSEEDQLLVEALAADAAAAIQNAQLYQVVTRRLEELSFLHEVALAGAGGLSLDQVLNRIIEALQRLTGWSNFGIVLLDKEKGELVPGAAYGVPEDIVGSLRIPLGQGLTGRVAQTGQPLLIPDVRAEPGYLEVLAATRSEMCVPIKLEDRVIGVLNAESSEVNAFSRDDLRLVSTLAGQVAVLIENARLYEETHRRLTELSALFEVSSALREAHTVEEMLPIILDKSVEVMDAESGHLALLKNGEEELGIRAVQGISPASPGQQFELASLPAGCPVHTSQPAACPPGCPLYLREHVFICAPLATPEGVIGTLTVGRMGDWSVSAGATRLLATIADLAGNAIYRAGLHEELEESYLQTVLALANAIDARDSYTGGHGERLAVWATAVARELSCSEEEIELVRWGALLHDVGKIGVPDHILLKPGPLNDEERAIMQRHPEIGGKIVEPVKRLQAVAPIICHHQERWDGTGYPAGLKGEQIPLEARILAVVDAYGAITDDRVYRKGRSHEEAVRELKHNAGTQFDPQVVEAFLRLVGPSAGEHWRLEIGD